MDRCPSCQSRWVRRRDASWFDRIAIRLTSKEPYLCDSCGWRGWQTPLLAASVSVRLPSPTHHGKQVDPLSTVVGEDAHPCDSIELFESEKPSRQEGIPEQQPESLREASPIAAPPRVGSPRAPWMPRELSHALRLLHTVPYEQLVSGMRRYQLMRLKVSRSEVIRFSVFFALGLAAGAFLVWQASEAVLPPPSIDTPGSIATAETSGTKPSEPPPSQLGVPVASVGQTPSVVPALPSARAPQPDRYEATVVTDRSTPSRLERRSTVPGTFARSRGSLAIDSHPPGARVSVDGRQVGSTPLVLKDMPAGTHVVRVEANGYQAWAWTARVVANQRSRVNVKLYNSARQ